MPNWKIKALLQDVLSVLPGGHSCNTLLQKCVTRRLHLTAERFEQKISQCQRHLAYCEAASGGQRTFFRVLELGTGWYPIIPIGMYLCGASVVWTVDIVSLLSRERVAQTLAWFLRYAERGRLAEILPQIRPDRFAGLKEAVALSSRGHTLWEMLKPVQVIPVVGNVRSAPFENHTVEMFISNCVLEHIPRADILGVFATFKRLAAPNAMMSHLVDMADHYADYDPSITSFNFLRYSERTWRWFNSSLNYQNRLRLADYRKIHEIAGFRILQEHNAKGSRAELEATPLASEFQGYDGEDLQVIKAWIISTPDRAEEQEP